MRFAIDACRDVDLTDLEIDQMVATADSAGRLAVLHRCRRNPQ
jgi:hypothetical protein